VKALILALSLLGAPLLYQADAQTVAPYVKRGLSPIEIKDLLHMREEEKLARDVYLTLSKFYSTPVFKNIARSEERHMEAIKSLLDRYGLPDPVAQTGGAVGVFKNPKFKALYNQLVAQGRRSLTEALKVGATIEELDIKDLQEAISRTDNPDIKRVYSNLMRGSKNHLRAFVRLLRRQGADYTPKYITLSEFNSILSSPPKVGSPSSGASPSKRGLLEHFEGKVISVEKVAGLRGRNVYWWVLVLQTPKGVTKVRLAPSWFLPQVDVKPGDYVEVEAYSPPYWRLNGIGDYIACRVFDKTAGKTYDFSKWRKWCAKAQGR